VESGEEVSNKKPEAGHAAARGVICTA